MIEWNESDSVEFGKYLEKSNSGKKLIEYLRSMRPAIAITPSEKVQPTHEAVSIGASMAHGYEVALQNLENTAVRPKDKPEASSHEDMS